MSMIYMPDVKWTKNDEQYYWSIIGPGYPDLFLRGVCDGEELPDQGRRGGLLPAVQVDPTHVLWEAGRAASGSSPLLTR